MYESFGSRLKRKIKEAGIRQKDFADFIGISEKALSHIITDKTQPRLDTLRLISHYLDSDYTDLITGDTIDVMPNGEYKQDYYWEIKQRNM